MSNRISILTLAACLLISFEAYCGWPTRPRRLVVSPTLSFFHSTSDWDRNGNSIRRENNGSFNSTSFSLYSEYGLSRRFAVTASIPYINYSLKDAVYGTNSVSGLGDLEAGLKYYLANIAYKYYFTLQGTVILPLYSSSKPLGYAQNGGELRLGFSGAGKLGSKFYSLSLENGVRQYFGTDGPIQDRYSASFGITLDRKFRDQLTLGASGLISASSIKAYTQNIYTTRDFSYTQVSLSYGHSFNTKTALFLSAGQFVTGRNTGIGTTGTVSLIFKLDNVFDRKLNY
ncbi:hypothetical protein KHS38_21370 [Mucilaginibacter sp. Bleaf8]|uniref:hypothetical protein n=1 Tax=Mucilaginibacter sp. Bleaf8 TaxID=2834430 RepID=UPI001BCF9572|nr:hypothetical protein [Mucilaginibacter sp. Bleaf8]MBS7566969.1 hypothetical protein [Mucilaginibacter sp. Bleaf8]